jgi:CheY-like chemotaxis protein
LKTGQLQKKSVLLVDDNPDIQTVISISMEQLGFQVHSFASGLDAIDELDEVQPRFAIIDYGLPDMTGIEVGRAIREWKFGNQVKLIMFSGSFDPAIKREADSIGFDAYLTKPIRLSVLRELVVSESN